MYAHYLRSIGLVLSVSTIILNMIFQVRIMNQFNQLNNVCFIKRNITLNFFFFYSVAKLNLSLQGFSIGSNVWLSVWSSDDTMKNLTGSEYTGKRDMYLGVYGALGFGQGKTIAMPCNCN